MVFDRNWFPKMTDFSRLGALQAVTYTLKVIVSKMARDRHIVIIHHEWGVSLAYLFMPFPMTLGDFEGHSPNAGLSINAIRRAFV